MGCRSAFDLKNGSRGLPICRDTRRTWTFAWGFERLEDMRLIKVEWYKRLLGNGPLSDRLWVTAYAGRLQKTVFNQCIAPLDWGSRVQISPLQTENVKYFKYFMAARFSRPERKWNRTAPKVHISAPKVPEDSRSFVHYSFRVTRDC